jgi:hypothetical protein
MIDVPARWFFLHRRPKYVDINHAVQLPNSKLVSLVHSTIFSLIVAHGDPTCRSENVVDPMQGGVQYSNTEIQQEAAYETASEMLTNS